MVTDGVNGMERKLFEELLESTREALAHAKEKRDLRTSISRTIVRGRREVTIRAKNAGVATRPRESGSRPSK